MTKSSEYHTAWDIMEMKLAAKRSARQMSSRCCLFTKTLFALLAFAFIIIALIVTVRTLQLSQRSEADLKAIVNYEEKFTENDTERLVANLAAAVGFETISYDSGEQDEEKRAKAMEALVGFREFILTNFSSVFEKDFVTLVGEKDGLDDCKNSSYPSMVIRVKGRNSSLAPYMLCAHLDVVPAKAAWINNTNPFELRRDIDDENREFLYGRGTLDNKDNLLGILEVLNQLDEQPRRSFYVAFGHDEEIGGPEGARHIAECMENMLQNHHEGKRLAFIMDEGMFISNGTFPMVDRPLALIGVAEKGELTINVSVTANPGHSSVPPMETAITKLGKAVARFTGDAHPAVVTDLQRQMLWKLAPYSDFPLNVVMTNVWLFEPFIRWTLAKTGKIAALMRTSTAVTIIKGGTKINIAPGYAEALINHRILPGSTLENVLQRDRDLVKDIENVTINVVKWKEPVGVNPINVNSSERPKDIGLLAIHQTMGAVFPSAIVVPSLMIAGTDTKHYTNLSHFIYRFSPVNIHIEETSRIHGDNERIAVEQYRKLCNFYWHLVKTMNNLDDNSGFEVGEDF